MNPQESSSCKEKSVLQLQICSIIWISAVVLINSGEKRAEFREL